MSKSDTSGISDIDGIRSTTHLNLNMKRRSFYELQPRNPKKQIRQL